MDLSFAKTLYESGLSVRKVARALGIRRYPTVHAYLVRVGVKRRANGTAHLYPQVALVCDTCGKQFKRVEYDAELGCGTRAHPRPPTTKYCSIVCQSHGQRRLALERSRRKTIVQVDYR